jgi:MIP family channel proteins
MAKLVRPLLAEFLGTLLFVFVGCTSVIANGITTGGLGILGVAAAHGVAIAVVASAFMNISGAHFNPAVTAGVFMARKIDAPTAGFYVLAQLAGATAAALILKAVVPVMAGRITALGTPTPGTQTGTMAAIVMEGILAIVLVSAVMGTAVAQNAPKIGGLAIGLAVFAGALVGAPLSGGVFNPARAFGPALVSWQWTAQMIYWIGPLVGGAVAGLVWAKFLLPKDPTQVQ